MGKERLEIKLPSELGERMDDVVELLGFGSRDELVEAAVRRFLDRYRILDILVRL